MYYAYLKARKGKRYRGYTLDFTDNLEPEIWSIIRDLKEKTYMPGPYHTFTVFRAKGTSYLRC